METCGRIHLAELVSFENVEHFDQDYAAGRGRRHRHDAISAIAAERRLTFDGLVALEIFARHDAARRANRAGELLSDRAAIECARSLAGDGRERIGEVALE